ncbi:hypothetical protein HCN44_010683 [Aphidius gifuensis]|uniref:Endonuclease/exonuclease/phosphatase domain-containing protein n=1 Tax=Aphidius gifuensis TaxID=684658 RepID=A0A834XUJ3_APHGI|nr:endonuclease/exonuclease/phosphatase family domain-containing protein 1-like [Aphidius gifuensis]KAF7991882.1 hypothetical protein HCN44_010683 [Aphidius gifuensis]
MGQVNSSHHDDTKTKRSNFKSQLSLTKIGIRKFKNSKNLSHTFSLVDESLKAQQLNINTATEEELMTLPGINRILAEKIVNHRRLIGRFFKIEDLALVSGIGADKLESIKPEIYVSQSNGSGISSRTSTSLDSVGNTDSQVDINSASIFDLQVVPGVDQELASRIVEKRLKRGCYYSIDEIGKLRGVGKYRLAIIKPHLKINGYTNGTNKKLTNGGSPSSSSLSYPQASSTPRTNNIKKINRDKIQPIPMSDIDDDDNVNDEDHESDKMIDLNPGITENEIWELLSIASPRPQLDNDYITNLTNRKSIRIATWNLNNFNTDKAENHGVMEIICRTILENRLSIIALQEIKSQDALEKLTNELNVPSIKKICDWRENNKKWKSIHLGAGLAILWNSCEKKNIIIKEQPPETTVFLPVLASIVFHVNKIDLTIINVQMHGNDDNNIIDRFIDAKNSIFLGDFTLTNDKSNIIFSDVLCESNTAVDTDKYFFKDKIVWGKGTKKLVNTGNFKIVRKGLNHLGIPQGWKWGGPASNHCPVWCEIYTEPSE